MGETLNALKKLKVDCLYKKSSFNTQRCGAASTIPGRRADG